MFPTLCIHPLSYLTANGLGLSPPNLYIAPYVSVVLHCVYLYRIFFIQSSTDGHLGCFHVLAIVNNAAVNIGLHVSFRMSGFVSVFIFALDVYPGVELLNHTQLYF